MYYIMVCNTHGTLLCEHLWAALLLSGYTCRTDDRLYNYVIYSVDPRSKPVLGH